jgi:ATP-dependent Lhr-like helicase
LEIVNAAYPFSKVTSTELDALLKFMEGRRLLEIHDTEVSKGARTRVFYYDRLSMIPDTKQVNAVDITTRTSIGVLDEDYVTANVEPGSVFVIRGRPWNVVSIDDQSGEVMCAPATGTDTDAPRWVGEMIPVPFEVASDVAKMWNSILSHNIRTLDTWLADFGISGESITYLVETLRQSKEVLGEIPSPDLYILETFGAGIVLHSPLGTRANETLGIVIASLLTTRLGTVVAVERDPYRILFTAKDGLKSSHILDVLNDYTADQVSHILRLAVKQTQNFASRFVHVGRRMDIIRKDAKSKQIPVKYLIKSFEGTPVFEEAIREVLEEKLDEKRAMEVFDRFSSGNLKFHEVNTLKPSPLARLIIEEKTRFEVMGEITEEDEVLRMIEERLLSKQFRLICMAENHWNSVRTITTMEDVVTCPICESKMIGVLQLSDKDFPKLLEKRLRGESLTKDEEKKYRAASLTAELVSRYGKTALLVLAGRGIGATTASRILSPGLNERLQILRAIAKGELQYERTRPYW